MKQPTPLVVATRIITKQIVESGIRKAMQQASKTARMLIDGQRRMRVAEQDDKAEGK